MAGVPGITMAASFPELTDLDPVLTEIFYQHLVPTTPQMDALFRLTTSTKGQEVDLRVGSIANPEPFRGQVDYHGIESDYSITYKHTEFADGIEIERKLLDDAQYAGIFDSAAMLAQSFSRRRDDDAASVFNHAFSSSYTGYDSVALCSDSHPRGKNNATVVDNSYALALSKANLGTIRTAMRKFVDDQGRRISIRPDTLLVPPDLEETAHDIVRSPLDPDSANNRANMFYGLLKVIVWDALTDTNAWFLIDSQMSKRYLKWVDRISPEFAAVDDFDTMRRKYRGYMRYSYGWSEWRWIIGSNPS